MNSNKIKKDKHTSQKIFQSPKRYTPAGKGGFEANLLFIIYSEYSNISSWLRMNGDAANSL